MTQCCCIGTYISLKHHTFICILNFRTPLPCNSWLKGGFPLGEMNGDFPVKFIWACAFLFVYSLAGKIFLFKIVRIYLIRDEKSRHNCLTNQNTNLQTLLEAPATLLTRDSDKYFPVKFAKFLKEHLCWRASVNNCFCISRTTSNSKQHCRRFSKTAKGEEGI